MNTRWIVTFALWGAIASSCGDNHEQQFCVEIKSKLRNCGLLTSGVAPCGEPKTRDDDCRADCLLSSSCADLQEFYCNSDELTGTLACIRSCETVQPVCANGSKLHPRDICDAIQDCADGSDERNCSPDAFYTCDDGRMIADERRCDGIDDCVGADDESGCPANINFQCRDGEELPVSWQCDNEVDCVDGSDELGCATFQCNATVL